MFRFFKEIYLTAFIIIFKLPSRRGNNLGKIGGAIGAITLIEWFVLIGISWYIEMFLNKKIYFSKPVVLIAFFALFLVNQCVLYTLGHGIKFEREFDSLKKTRKILLVVSCAVLSVTAIVFGICSAIAHRHFIGANKP